MEALANATEMDTGATLRRLGEFALFNTTLSYRNNWRVGMDRGYIPLPFRHQGLLWWFQVLTTYLVRIKEPLSQQLATHPAMRPFVLPPNAARSAYATLDDVRWLGWSVRCGRKYCDGVGPGWMPSWRR